MKDDDEITSEGENGQVATTRRIATGAVLGAGRTLRDGRYVLERPLGYGGMAAVWLARDERLGREVAVKVLSDTLAHDEEYLTRFRREARVAARLTHPNLVTIYDYEAAERPFLVMELIEGGNLGERIEAGAEIPGTERLARELLAALRHIHAAGVLHRDVKPQNVLIGADGRARLTDFGIAQPRDATALTRTGMLVGTERYLAPELRSGEAATERSDLYALGVVLDGAGQAAGSTPAVEALVEQLRAELPEDRPQSASAALAALERAAGPAVGEPTERIAAVPAPVFGGDPTAPTDRLSDGDGVAAPPREAETPPASGWEPERAGGERRRRLLAAIGLGLVGVALILGLALGSGGGGGEPAELGTERTEPGPGSGGGGDSSGSGGAKKQAAADTAPAEQGGDPYALNDEGKALIDSGDPAAAIPLLERSVAGLEGCDCEYYAFALYNLGNALRLAGRPDEAIPILEQRLAIPNQTEVVAAELELARQEAGVSSDGGVSAGGAAGDGGVAASEGSSGEQDD